MTDLPKSYLQSSFEVTKMHPSVVMWLVLVFDNQLIIMVSIHMTVMFDIFCWFQGKKHPLGKTDSLNDHNKNCHKIRFSHVLTRLTSRTTYNHNSGLNYSNKSRTIYILCHHRVPIWLLSHVKYWTIVNSKFSFIIETIKNIFIWDFRIHLRIT